MLFLPSSSAAHKPDTVLPSNWIPLAAAANQAILAGSFSHTTAATVGCTATVYASTKNSKRRCLAQTRQAHRSARKRGPTDRVSGPSPTPNA